MGFLLLIGFVFVVLLVDSFEKSRFLKQNKSELFAGFSTYCLTLLSVLPDEKFIGSYTWRDSLIFLLIISGASFLISIKISASKVKELNSHNELKQKLTSVIESNKKIREEYYFLCSEYIRDVFSQFFALSPSRGNTRVSLYKHTGESFKLLGRYADNPLYNKRKEILYPDNLGFIAIGWQKGSFGICGIPEWKKSGSDYRNFVKSNCEISEERLKSISMHSRSFYIFRFDNKSGDGKPYGIIVFERLSEKEIPVDLINEIIEKHNLQISNLLKSMNALFKIND